MPFFKLSFSYIINQFLIFILISCNTEKADNIKKDGINENKNCKCQILISKKIKVMYVPIQKKGFFYHDEHQKISSS